MQIVYALEPIPETVTRSLFLAGPTPRGPEGNAWRQEAIKILNDIDFDGTVYVPEPRDGTWHKDYDGQVEWEDLCLNQADCIVFWVPRNLQTMPAFTTNDEWGTWKHSGKLVLGYPEPDTRNTPKMSYIRHYADKLKISVSGTLEDTLKAGIDFIGTGAERTGGARMVPYYLWKTPHFQSWYSSQVSVGNRLDDARVLYTFRPRNGKFVFLWVLHVNVYIASEKRSKTNEFVLSRTDISSVLMWRRQEPLSNSEIVLVREFRSPGRTIDGFVWELPGGSAMAQISPAEVAAEEIEEETGLHLDPSRLRFHAAKQLAGTLSSHQSHAFEVELTEEEVFLLRSQKSIAHGIEEDSERTFVEVVTLDQILYQDFPVDWATIGMIMFITDKL